MLGLRGFLKKINFQHLVLTLIPLFVILTLYIRPITLSWGDMGRYLLNGKLFYDGNFEFIFKNYLSYTNPEFNLVNHHWLTGVIFYTLYIWGDFTLLSAFHIFLVLCNASLCLLLARKKSTTAIASSVFLFCLYGLGVRTELRPELFSVLFMLVYYALLESHLNKNISIKTLYFILLPLQVLWVNLHIFFPFGPLVIFSFILFAKVTLKNKRICLNLLFLLISVSAVCILNPNFIKGAIIPLTIYSNFGLDMGEDNNIFRFIDTDPILVLLVLFYTFLSVGVVYLLYNKNRKAFLDQLSIILLTVFFAIASIFMYRMLPFYTYFGIILLSRVANIYLHGLSTSYRAKLNTYLRRFVVLYGLAIIVALFAVRDTYLGLKRSEVPTLNFLRSTNLNGPIFNNFNTGSFGAFAFLDEPKLFLDNRPEAQPKEFFTEVYLPILQSREIWEELAASYGFKTVVLSIISDTDLSISLSEYLINTGEWKLVYISNPHIVLVKDIPENHGIIDKYGYNDHQALVEIFFLQQELRENLQFTN